MLNYIKPVFEDGIADQDYIFAGQATRRQHEFVPFDPRDRMGQPDGIPPANDPLPVRSRSHIVAKRAWRWARLNNRQF